LQNLTKLQTIPVENTGNIGSIDTSLLLEELRRDYQRRGTPLDVNFREMLSWVKLGDQFTHQIHPYPAKLLPHIAALFVNARKLNPGHSVLDPFCGSGTVALEASIAGNTALIADANPLALLLAQVKTTPYEIEKLLHLTADIITQTKRFKTAPSISIVNSTLWYKPEVKQNLERLLRAINRIESIIHREFFLACFSVVTRRLSLADPSISVPVRLKAKASLGARGLERVKERIQWLSTADYLEEFSSVCLTNINRVLKTNEAYPHRRRAIVVGNDARQLIPSNNKDALEVESADLILTSPPYGSAQKYIRAVSLSLNWLGLAVPSQLTELESKSIGREHLPKRYSGPVRELPPAFEDFVYSTAKINPSRAEITRTYLSDMESALKEMARTVNPNGRIVIVMGNNEVCGQILRNDEFVQEIMQANGFKTELYLLDKIKSRGLLTKRNSSAPIIARESILMFRKANET
jgi:tRNA G10  N-methylase Trm11